MAVEKRRFFKPEADVGTSLFVVDDDDNEADTSPNSTSELREEATEKLIPLSNDIKHDDLRLEDPSQQAEFIVKNKNLQQAVQIRLNVEGDSKCYQLTQLIQGGDMSKRKREYDIKQDEDQPQSKIKQLPSYWTRFIGSLTIQAWATRPTTRPLAYQQKLSIRKQTSGVVRARSKNSESSLVKLFSVPQEREIGRIPSDLANIVAPLLDLDVITCDGSTIMDTENRLSIGDSFYIQIDFYLTLNAFKQRVRSNDSADNSLKTTKSGANNWNFSAETHEESVLRLRQASLAKLFEQLNISPKSEDLSSRKPVTIDLSDEEADLSDTDMKLQQSQLPIHTQNLEPDTLNLDQLKQFYLDNQQSELMDGLPETTTPPKSEFKLELRPYQRKGLSWMLLREKELAVLEKLSKQEGDSQLVLSSQTRRVLDDEGMMNPLWKQYLWPKGLEHNKIDSNVLDEDHFYGNLYSGELSLEKPIIKSLVRGGIIGDEMGLGKTISTFSLITSVPYDSESVDDKWGKRYAYRATLVVVPMSLLSQWQSEFDKVNNNPMHRCLVYYGDQTTRDLQQLLCNTHDPTIPVVILTTYGTIQNEFNKANARRDEAGNLPKTGIYSVKFFRIVLDEGHTIRNRSTKTTKAIYELALKRRWVLTGTPVINRLDDLYSLVKFLEVEPWCNFSYWKTFVTLPFEQKKIGQTLDVVKSILEPIFIRRTKNMKQKDGKPLVVLPPKEVVIEEIQFNEKEQRLYDIFKARATESFNEGLASGELLRKYSQILTHILRLRQICCHMDLVKMVGEVGMDEELSGELGNNEEQTSDVMSLQENEKEDTFLPSEIAAFSKSILKNIDVTNSECSICTLAPILYTEMAVTPCGHTFCLTCILEHIAFQAKRNQKQANCPNCREPILKSKLFKVKQKREVKRIRGMDIMYSTQADDTSEDFSMFSLYLYDSDRASSKIQALVNHLKIINTQHPGEQVVVFSQFSSYLDIIEKELGIQFGDKEIALYKFDGRLHMNERKKILDAFAANKESKSGKTKVLLLSLKAGGVGLNLTSASRAFMMDPWWSPSIEDQAIDRIHRIGQVENVKVVRFIMRDSIEQKMLKIQQRKKQIGEAVAAEESERAQKRIEEIQMLFEE